MSNSWKPEVQVNGQWAGNALRFATAEEARDNGFNLMMRWMLVTGYRATESDDPVSHIWKDGALFDADNPQGPGYVPPERVSLT
jgi:hypothetical protein